MIWDWTVPCGKHCKRWFSSSVKHQCYSHTYAGNAASKQWIQTVGHFQSASPCVVLRQCKFSDGTIHFGAVYLCGQIHYSLRLGCQYRLYISSTPCYDSHFSRVLWRIEILLLEYMTAIRSRPATLLLSNLAHLFEGTQCSPHAVAFTSLPPKPNFNKFHPWDLDLCCYPKGLSFRGALCYYCLFSSLGEYSTTYAGRLHAATHAAHLCYSMSSPNYAGLHPNISLYLIISVVLTLSHYLSLFFRRPLLEPRLPLSTPDLHRRSNLRSSVSYQMR